MRVRIFPRGLLSGKNSQGGIVSLAVTVIIVLILSLIIVTFSTLVRREQRQTIDRQLATQAFYAAESGVNDAVKALRSDASLRDFTDTGECGSFITEANLGASRELDAGSGTAYTCLLVDSKGQTIEFTNVSTGDSKIFPVKVDPSGPTISTIRFQWSDTDATEPMDYGSCGSLGELPSSWPSSGCDAGILRVDIVPYDALQDRDSLINNSFTAFFQPVPPGETGSVSFSEASGSGKQGKVVGGDCSSAGCQVDVNTGSLGVRNFWVRVKTIYTSGSKLTVTGADSSGNPLELIGAQYTIDATGKANDVLRRIQVRIPASEISGDGPGGLSFPEYVLQTSGSLCKRIEIIDDSSSSADAAADDPGECFINL